LQRLKDAKCFKIVSLQRNIELYQQFVIASRTFQRPQSNITFALMALGFVLTVTANYVTIKYYSIIPTKEGVLFTICSILSVFIPLEIWALVPTAVGKFLCISFFEVERCGIFLRVGIFCLSINDPVDQFCDYSIKNVISTGFYLVVDKMHTEITRL
jgi:hypothetical protein